MISTLQNETTQTLLIPLLLEDKILQLCIGKDPFARVIQKLRQNSTIDPALLERIKHPEIICTQELKESIHTYRDISLDPTHPLFSRINALVETLQKTSFSKKIRSRLELSFISTRTTSKVSAKLAAKNDLIFSKVQLISLFLNRTILSTAKQLAISFLMIPMAKQCGLMPMVPVL